MKFKSPLLLHCFFALLTLLVTPRAYAYEATVELQGYCKKIFALSSAGVYSERSSFSPSDFNPKTCKVKITLRAVNPANNALVPAAGVQIVSLRKNLLLGTDPNVEAATYHIADMGTTDRRGRLEIDVPYNPVYCGSKLSALTQELATQSSSGSSQSFLMDTQVLAKFNFTRVPPGSTKASHCFGEP